MLSLPDCVRKHLQRECFSVHLSSSEWHAVALDEDAKMAVTHPSVHKIEHISNHLPFRTSGVARGGLGGSSTFTDFSRT